MADAARADLIAVAVEKGDGELGLLQPVVLGGLAERRQGERQHEHKTAESQREPFRDRLDQGPAPPTRAMKPVPGPRVALVELAPRGPRQVRAEIDARMEVEIIRARPRLPMLRVLIVVEQVAQHHQSSCARAALLADPTRPYHCLDVTRARNIEPCGAFK